MTHGWDRVSLGPVSIDLENSRILRDGTELDLRPQACRVLVALAQRTGHFVDYDSLLQTAWDGTHVAKHTVAVTVGEVKKALGPFGCWITHRPRCGYRLDVPPVEDLLNTGWHFLSRQTREGLEKALYCFEKASRESDADGRATYGIAHCHLLLGIYGMHAPQPAYARFREAHQRCAAAWGLTPDLRADRAHALAIFECRPADAIRELRDAYPEPLKPAKVYVRQAIIYASQGEFQPASQAIADAFQTHPLHPELPAMEALLHFLERDFERAAASGEKAVELHPYLPMSRLHYALALELCGRFEEALAEYRVATSLSAGLNWIQALEGHCLACDGRLEEARQVAAELDQAREVGYVDSYHFSQLLDAMGDREGARRELRRAFEERSSMLHMLDVDPKMDGLRKEAPGAGGMAASASGAGSGG